MKQIPFLRFFAVRRRLNELIEYFTDVVIIALNNQKRIDSIEIHRELDEVWQSANDDMIIHLLEREEEITQHLSKVSMENTELRCMLAGLGERLEDLENEWRE